MTTASRSNGAIDLTDKSGRGRVRRVCVIGGAGYVGSVLIERLLDEGYAVTVLDAAIGEPRLVEPGLILLLGAVA